MSFLDGFLAGAELGADELGAAQRCELVGIGLRLRRDIDGVRADLGRTPEAKELAICRAAASAVIAIAALRVDVADLRADYFATEARLEHAINENGEMFAPAAMAALHSSIAALLVMPDEDCDALLVGALRARDVCGLRALASVAGPDQAARFQSGRPDWHAAYEQLADAVAPIAAERARTAHRALASVSDAIRGALADIDHIVHHLQPTAGAS